MFNVLVKPLNQILVRPILPTHFADDAASSCSQIRKTCQPIRRRRALFWRSLAMLPATFTSQ